MHHGVFIFPTDYSIRPDELARAVEERGFESLFVTDHTHIPATAQTRTLMQELHGGVLPRFTHNYDPFVALTYAAAVTQTLRLGTGVCLVPEREPIASWPKPAQQPHPPILVGGAGTGVIRRVLAYGDEWMPHAGIPVEELGARIRELQHAATEAGRSAEIPVTIQGAEPDARRLN